MNAEEFRAVIIKMLTISSDDLCHTRKGGNYMQAACIEAERDMLFRLIALIDMEGCR